MITLILLSTILGVTIYFVVFRGIDISEPYPKQINKHTKEVSPGTFVTTVTAPEPMPGYRCVQWGSSGETWVAIPPRQPEDDHLDMWHALGCGNYVPYLEPLERNQFRVYPGGKAIWGE